MARVWVDGEGVPITDLVRLGTYSGDTYQALHAHVAQRRGLAHPLVKRHSVYNLGGDGKIVSATETYNDSRVSSLQVSGNNITSTFRNWTLEYNKDALITIQMVNRG